MQYGTFTGIDRGRHRGLPVHDAFDRRVFHPQGQRKVQQRLLYRRPFPGPDRHGDERRGVGHEQLPADGHARPGLHRRHRGGRMDGHRPGGGYLSELLICRQTAAPLFLPDRRVYDPRVFLQALRRKKARAFPDRRADHPGVLYPLHGVRL